MVSGVLGVCLPIASVSGTFLIQLFTGNQLAMFMVPCAIGGFFILLFAVTLKDRRVAKEDKPTWSPREFASTFYVNPRKSPDFAWAFVSRLMFVLAYGFLVTFQAYYLLDKIGTAEADVPHQIFLGTLTQALVVVAASLIGGRLSDRTGRRKIFVLTASIVYGLSMFVVAIASDFNGRAGHPGARQRQLWRAVRGSRGLRHSRSRHDPAREGRPMSSYSAQTSRTHPRSQRWAASASRRTCQSNETVTSGVGNGRAKVCMSARRFAV